MVGTAVRRQWPLLQLLSRKEPTQSHKRLDRPNGTHTGFSSHYAVLTEWPMGVNKGHNSCGSLWTMFPRDAHGLHLLLTVTCHITLLLETGTDRLFIYHTYY